MRQSYGGFPRAYIIYNKSMKRIYFILVLFAFSMVVCAQSRLSDDEVLQKAITEKRSGASESQIASTLLKQGASMKQIRRIRSQYAKQITKTGMDNTVDNAISDAAERMRTDIDVSDNTVVAAAGKDAAPVKVGEILPETSQVIGKKVFGRDIFNNKSLTFQPNMNIATPQNYVLGPGDQLIIDVYGASAENLKLTVSPEGEINVPEYGPIHVGGLSVSAAKARVNAKLGRYFQSSEINTTLGQTRSIQINVLGEVRVPGTYTLSSLSTVFHALYRAGGTNDIGTLRNIKLYRQGRLVTVVDVYEFILNGRLAGNVRLEDNDVIQVGPYDCLVDIVGHVKRPMTYELRNGESLSTLLKYCGGFSSDAFKKTLRVNRNTGQMKSVFNVDEFDFSSFKLMDGDGVGVEAIYDRYENMVEVKGAVFRPGMYQLGERIYSIKTLLERAEGLTEEAMSNRAVLRRLKPNRTQEVLSVNIEGILNGTEPDMPLQNEDVLFIPTQADHQNLRTLTIAGEVVFPGTYEYAENMTIENFILQAGGLTDAASTAKVDVSRRYHNAAATSAGLDLTQTYSFTIDEQFRFSEDKDFKLEPFDIVQVRRSPTYQDPITVSVDGEVVFRGYYTMQRKNMRLSDLVKAAGGVVEGAYVRGARLERKMSEDEKARIMSVIRMARQSGGDTSDSISLQKLALRTTYTVGIYLDEALAHPGSTQDVELCDGDHLVIPRFNHTVRISGDVNTPNTVAYEPGKNYKYYINQAGGFGERAKKRNAYIIYQNGTMAMAKKGKIEPGCEVIVPTKVKKDPANVQQWVAIGTGLASIGTMFATIAHLLK